MEVCGHYNHDSKSLCVAVGEAEDGEKVFRDRTSTAGVSAAASIPRLDSHSLCPRFRARQVPSVCEEGWDDMRPAVDNTGMSLQVLILA